MAENKYEVLRKRQKEEFNKFPIGFAFDDKQFKETMEKLGLKESDTDKIVSIGAGGFIRKSDVKAFNEMNKRHRQEEKEAIESDTTGTEFIKDMFLYELINHEYGYTGEIDDTLEALSLTIDDINNNPKLFKGLELAKQIIIRKEQDKTEELENS